MLERPTDRHEAPHLTLAQARAQTRTGDGDMAALLGWIESYLMMPHAELGREGAVCPFTRQSARIDAIRVAMSCATAAHASAVSQQLRSAIVDLDRIPCKAGMEHFRTIVIGFPECAGDAGIAMLKRAQADVKWLALRRFRMTGLMFSESEVPGLWNPAFRPQRSPMPILAVRHMVENDAFFAVRHPLLCIPYLAKYGLGGAKRLWSAWRARP